MRFKFIFPIIFIWMIFPTVTHSAGDCPISEIASCNTAANECVSQPDKLFINKTTFEIVGLPSSGGCPNNCCVYKCNSKAYHANGKCLCSIGHYYEGADGSGTDCSICPTGYYCPQQSDRTSENSRELCPGTHTKTDNTGSTQKNDCFEICNNKPITNGYWIPNSGTDTKKYFNDGACEWTLVDDDHIKCDTGYHREGSACVDNEDNCPVYDLIESTTSVTGSGIKTWNSSDGWNVPCIVKTCNANHHKSADNKECLQDNKVCTVSKFIDLRTSSSGGTAAWSGNTSNPTDYNKSACYKDVGSEQLTAPDSTPSGTRSNRCFWTSGNDTNDNAEYNTNCTYNVTKCNAGFWSVNGGAQQTVAANAVCSDAGKGYYSPANDLGRYGCPKATTTQGNRSVQIGDCAIFGGTDASDMNATKFCDSKGCFALPSGIEIHVQ